jgi:hypothetical protein
MAASFALSISTRPQSQTDGGECLFESEEGRSIVLLYCLSAFECIFSIRSSVGVNFGLHKRGKANEKRGVQDGN